MDYKPYQRRFGEATYLVLKSKGVAYIQGAPRSGKTATALNAAERSKLKRWLILTPKQAILGWAPFLKGLPLGHTYSITNYEQVYMRYKTPSGNTKYKLRLNPNDYDGFIIDEAHNLGSFPKPGNRQKTVKALIGTKPVIFLSGTAIIESPMSIYHQLWVTGYSPFRGFKNFYDFHRHYGIPYFIRAGGRDINQYDKYKPELLPLIEEISIFMTQEDAGIAKEIQAADKLHFITLSDSTRELYNELTKHNIVTIGTNVLVCDSVMKLRTSLHMLESGVYKIDDDYYYTGQTEKIDYIMDTFGDTKDVGIMCHFIGEQRLLKKRFKNATIYSSTSHAEGVDLSHLKHFVVLSSGYSGAKFVQRRERIINTNGSNTLTVHHILVKGAISHQVYKAVSKKRDFNNRLYERGTL